MKQCPACKTTYTDETLVFCLADGSPLTSIDIEQATVIRPGVSTTPQIAPQSGSMGWIVKVILVVIGLIIFALLAAGAAGFVFYYMSGSGNASNDNTKPTVSPTPAAKDDKDELRDQIANLEKRLNEQKKSGQPANIPLTIPMQSTMTTSARVNSPGDGFLALRSLPNSEAGERITKIPHGATISIGACGPAVTPVKRSGRWCQASYNGATGWVFDAYLVY